MTKSVFFLVSMKLDGFVFVLLLREGLERYPFFLLGCVEGKKDTSKKPDPKGHAHKKKKLFPK